MSTPLDPKAYVPHLFVKPKVHESVYVAPNAIVLGDVEIGQESSIWFGCVVRGDVNYIRIGERSNVQDLTLIHVSYKTLPAVIGNDVTVGHSCVLHACKIGDFTLIGMGSTVLDGAEIGDHVLLGAGSLVTPGTKIPPRSKAMGRPARIIGEISDEELSRLEWNAKHYVNLAKAYRI